MESKVYKLLVKMVDEYNDNAKNAMAYFATIQVQRDLNKASEYLKMRKDRLTYRMEACCDYAEELAKILGVKLKGKVNTIHLYDLEWYYTTITIEEQEEHHE